MKIEEITIPAPWGHIAAKLWGDPSNEAIIVTHGFQDNAGSFDRLIPILPTHFFYICMDLPGHGYSSQFHDIMPLHFHNFILAYIITAEYFKRKKYILMAHSFGGELSLVFAQWYPNLVSKLIIIDAVYPMPIEADVFVPMIRNAHDLFFKQMEQDSNKRPRYSYKEIVEKIQNSRYNGELTFQTAEDLAKRMIKSVGNDKYVITTDSKLKGFNYPGATIQYNIELFKVKPIKCPVLLLLAPFNDYTLKSAGLVEYFEEVGFSVKPLNGHHHIHQTDPEVIKDDITNFLNTQNSKL